MKVEVVVLIAKVRYEQMSACADALALLEGLTMKWSVSGETPAYATEEQFTVLATGRVEATVDAPSEDFACSILKAMVATAVRAGNELARLKHGAVNEIEPIGSDQISCTAKAVK